MSLAGPADILQVKRGSEVDFTNCVPGTGYDHFRIQVHKLNTGGTFTLQMTTDPFSYCPAYLLAGDEDNPATFEFHAVDNTFYKVEIWEYDAGETISALEDEHFLHCFPDSLETQGDEALSLNSTLFTKLLFMLGHNVLDGNFLQPAGYTQSRVRRGYSSLTTHQADDLLEDSDAPSESNMQFKSKIILTTSDHGDELMSAETEQDVT